MKTLNSTPLLPVLGVIGSEIAEAHKLLIGFEHAIDQADLKAAHLKKQVQGFDLALQILGDVQHLTEVLAQQFSPETALPCPLPISGIRLERVREKLSQNQALEIHRQGSTPAVDLF